MRPDTSQWRSSSAYDYLDDLIASDLAWEWLRRNADYQRDYDQVGQADVDRQHLTNTVRMRWGLQFPCRPSFQCHRDDGVLGTRSRSWHSNAHSESVITGLEGRCAT